LIGSALLADALNPSPNTIANLNVVTKHTQKGD
jgi:hypothetical protein